MEQNYLRDNLLNQLNTLDQKQIENKKYPIGFDGDSNIIWKGGINNDLYSMLKINLHKVK